MENGKVFESHEYRIRGKEVSVFIFSVFSGFVKATILIFQKCTLYQASVNLLRSSTTLKVAVLKGKTTTIDMVPNLAWRFCIKFAERALVLAQSLLYVMILYLQRIPNKMQENIFFLIFLAHLVIGAVFRYFDIAGSLQQLE